MSTEPELPTFNNGITPPNPLPAAPVDGVVPRLPIDPTVAPVAPEQYQSPVEAVPGVGGIPGVSAE
jgi:hypothetical protein